MKSLLRLVAGALLLVSLQASAMTMYSTRAYVVSVDSKAKALTFRLTKDEGKTWQQSTATWDDKTEWSRSEEQIYKSTPASAELAGTLKKDSKIYLAVSNAAGEDQWAIESLSTIPADSEIQ